MGPQVKTRMGDRSGRGSRGSVPCRKQWRGVGGGGGEAFQDVPGGVETKYEAVRSGIFVS